jgi:hypothetical protein
MKFYTVSLGLITSLIAGAVFAQNSAGFVEIGDDVSVAPFSMTADQVDDLDVHDAAGKKIGDVEEVLGTQADTATALAVDFDDGAGYGERGDVIVPIDQFRLDGNRLVLSADAAAIAGMPVWDD